MAIRGGRADLYTRPPGPGPDGEYPMPGPDETPWRSACYATWGQSADGNDYRPGDPIPYAEALRQGLVDEDTPPPVIGERCQRCKGGKHYANPVPKGHTIGCACKFCQPCPRCAGSGREKEAA